MVTGASGVELGSYLHFRKDVFDIAEILSEALSVRAERFNYGVQQNVGSANLLYIGMEAFRDVLEQEIEQRWQVIKAIEQESWEVLQSMRFYLSKKGSFRKFLSAEEIEKRLKLLDGEFFELTKRNAVVIQEVSILKEISDKYIASNLKQFRGLTGGVDQDLSSVKDDLAFSKSMPRKFEEFDKRLARITTRKQVKQMLRRNFRYEVIRWIRKGMRRVERIKQQLSWQYTFYKDRSTNLALSTSLETTDFINKLLSDTFDQKREVIQAEAAKRARNALRPINDSGIRQEDEPAQKQKSIEQDPGIRAMSTRLVYVPYDEDTRWELAKRYMNIGEYASAIQVYQELLDHRPEWDDARMELVSCLVTLGKWKEAETELSYLKTFTRYTEKASQMLEHLVELT